MRYSTLNRHLKNGSDGLANGTIDPFLRPATNERASLLQERIEQSVNLEHLPSLEIRPKIERRTVRSEFFWRIYYELRAIKIQRKNIFGSSVCQEM